MNKILKKVSTAIILSSALIAPVFAEGTNIVINNNKIETPDAPYIKEERTLVPLDLFQKILALKLIGIMKIGKLSLKKVVTIFFCQFKRIII